MRLAGLAIVVVLSSWSGPIRAESPYLACAKYLATMRELHRDPDRSGPRTDDTLRALRDFRQTLRFSSNPRDQRALARVDEMLADVRRAEVRTFGVITRGRPKILRALERRERLADEHTSLVGARGLLRRIVDAFARPAETRLRAALASGGWFRHAFRAEASLAALNALWEHGRPSAEGARHFPAGNEEPTALVMVDEILINDPADPRFLTLLRWTDHPHLRPTSRDGGPGERGFDWRSLFTFGEPVLAPIPVRAGYARPPRVR